MHRYLLHSFTCMHICTTHFVVLHLSSTLIKWLCITRTPHWCVIMLCVAIRHDVSMHVRGRIVTECSATDGKKTQPCGASLSRSVRVGERGVEATPSSFSESLACLLWASLADTCVYCEFPSPIPVFLTVPLFSFSVFWCSFFNVCFYIWPCVYNTHLVGETLIINRLAATILFIWLDSDKHCDKHGI